MSITFPTTFPLPTAVYAASVAVAAPVVAPFYAAPVYATPVAVAAPVVAPVYAAPVAVAAPISAPVYAAPVVVAAPVYAAPVAVKKVANSFFGGRAWILCAMNPFPNPFTHPGDSMTHNTSNLMRPKFHRVVYAS